MRFACIQGVNKTVSFSRMQDMAFCLKIKPNIFFYARLRVEMVNVHQTHTLSAEEHTP